jgi:hypothetical protein
MINALAAALSFLFLIFSRPILINVIGEWDEFEKIITENNVEVIDLKLRKYFKQKKINGFFLSRYYQIKILDQLSLMQKEFIIS